MADDNVNLPHVPTEIKKLTGGTVTYRRIWHMAASGLLPGAEFVDGRWYVPRDRLNDVAEAVGLSVSKAA